jgi:hypothetical protein
MDSCILLYRYKDDILISDSNKYGTFDNLQEQNQTLFSTSVNGIDNGTYTCKVSDGINEIQHKIQLYVLRKFVLTLFILELCCMSVINSTIIFQIGVINFVDWHVFVCVLEQFHPQTV